MVINFQLASHSYSKKIKQNPPNVSYIADEFHLSSNSEPFELYLIYCHHYFCSRKCQVHRLQLTHIRNCHMGDASGLVGRCWDFPHFNLTETSPREDSGWRRVTQQNFRATGRLTAAITFQIQTVLKDRAIWAKTFTIWKRIKA